MFEEFKKFAMRGNVVDLAVGVIIDAAAKSGAVTLNYGIFINILISFVIVAWAVFLVIKAMNRLQKKEEAPPTAPPAPAEDILLLREIRDALKK